MRYEEVNQTRKVYIFICSDNFICTSFTWRLEANRKLILFRFGALIHDMPMPSPSPCHLLCVLVERCCFVSLILTWWLIVSNWNQSRAQLVEQIMRNVNCRKVFVLIDRKLIHMGKKSKVCLNEIEMNSLEVKDHIICSFRSTSLAQKL